MPENLSTLEKLETAMTMLDKLADAQGRAKCGYIYILNEFLTEVRNEVLILEEKLKDATKKESE